MKIDNFKLNNFRCFQQIEIPFHPKLNILVGVNGVGKTTLLEALRIFLGSIFVEIDKMENKIYSPSILPDDVRLLHLEPQFSTTMTGYVTLPDYLNNGIPKAAFWGRSLNTQGGKTVYDNRSFILGLSSTIQQKIRNGANEAMPLVAYYSTNRYKREKRNTGLEADGSRLRGYYNALDTTTNVWFFLDVYKTATLGNIQGRHQFPVLDAVQDTVVNLVPDCKKIWYDVARDGLYIDFNDGQTLPFNSLSDGVRCVLSMAFELAIRCYLLNPYLGADAAKYTPGVVLIDEIDLHLHPNWQRHILNDLVRAFPEMQFIVTTHSPMVLGSVNDCGIYSISDRNVYSFPKQYMRDVSAILSDMGKNDHNEEIGKIMSEYRRCIEEGNGRSYNALELRKELERRLGPNHEELQRADIMLALYSD